MQAEICAAVLALEAWRPVVVADPQRSQSDDPSRESKRAREDIATVAMCTKTHTTQADICEGRTTVWDAKQNDRTSLPPHTKKLLMLRVPHSTRKDKQRFA